MTNNVHPIGQESDEPKRSDSSSGGGSGGDLGERIARLETRMDYLATREDLEAMKVWFLKWAIMTILATVGITVSAVVIIIKVFNL